MFVCVPRSKSCLRHNGCSPCVDLCWVLGGLSRLLQCLWLWAGNATSVILGQHALLQESGISSDSSGQVRNLKIIPYKHYWGNGVFSSQRNRYMRRFNQFTYFLKFIIHLFHAYFIICSSEGSISTNFGSYRKSSLVYMKKQKPSNK